MKDRRTKIVATVGPSSISLVSELSRYVDVFRINLAHGSKDSIKGYFEKIRADAPNVSILADVPGPKLRVGDLRNPITVREGDKISFGDQIPVSDKIFFKLIRPGAQVLIADGTIKVIINAVEDERAIGTVIDGGVISSRKGINIPEVQSNIGLSDTDLELAQLAVNEGADFLGLSFVLSSEDIKKLKERVKDSVWIIAKIEKKGAINNLNEIVREADGIMVARGDLGVEVGLENLPKVQAKIIRKSRLYGKPVILATQVLESMVNSPIPTRAEVIDVANSVIEGVDAIMLSDETAIGKYPLEAVKTLDNLINSAEKNFKPRLYPPLKSYNDAIASAAVTAAQLASAKAIIIYTRTGSTALRVIRQRPKIKILVLTPNAKLAKKLKVCWGIETQVVKPLPTIDAIINTARIITEEKSLARSGDVIVITSGTEESATDFVKVEIIKS